MATGGGCTAASELRREGQTPGRTAPGSPNPREFFFAGTLLGEAGHSLPVERSRQLSPSQGTGSGDPAFPGKMEPGSARPH